MRVRVRVLGSNAVYVSSLRAEELGAGPVRRRPEDTASGQQRLVRALADPCVVPVA